MADFHLVLWNGGENIHARFYGLPRSADLYAFRYQDWELFARRPDAAPYENAEAGQAQHVDAGLYPAQLLRPQLFFVEHGPERTYLPVQVGNRTGATFRTVLFYPWARPATRTSFVWAPWATREAKAAVAMLASSGQIVKVATGASGTVIRLGALGDVVTAAEFLVQPTVESPARKWSFGKKLLVAGVAVFFATAVGVAIWKRG